MSKWLIELTEREEYKVVSIKNKSIKDIIMFLGGKEVEDED